MTPQMLDTFQQPFFDESFASQADAFTRFYEFVNSKRRLRELRRVRSAGRVLEVGVGRGNLLHALHSSGYEVHGIDLSPDVCARVSARYGFPVYCGNLEGYANSTREGPLDLVVMCHVLEHIESFTYALDAVRRLLGRAGLLYIAVPNVAAWQARLPGWTGYEPYHVHYFDQKRLTRALSSSGFDVVWTRTYEPLSGWFNALSRTLLYGTPDIEQPEPAPRFGRFEKPLLRTLYDVLRVTTGFVLSPLRWLQSAAGYGEELVMIAKVRSAA